ncbi:MAG: hypothetical protein J6K74_02940 [Marinifilaceae bacterium]|nr:hypothetical protein [Marinifilaceae bacterium]
MEIRKFSSALLLMGALVVGVSSLSCSDDDDSIADDENLKEEYFEAAINPYIDNTVRATYKGMADAAVGLAKSCDEMYQAFVDGDLTSAMVEEAGNYWKESRKYWEWSEAFLYGAAADYNIDPHIDSWPLDKNAMDQLLANIRAGQSWSVGILGEGLLGFHAVEYLLFELDATETNSMVHNLNYTEEELVYLSAVANDLCAQCVLLEASWAGVENVSSEKQAILEEAELEPSMNYGDNMKSAGNAGSLYKTKQSAVEDIVQGCIDIADEVANTKIGRPVLGATEEDKNYIESPYSLNSIVDFVGNIISIENAYCGSKSGDASISDFIAEVDADLDAEVKALIAESKSAIEAIPEPFAKSASTQVAADAQEKVNELRDILEEVMEAVVANY